MTTNVSVPTRDEEVQASLKAAGPIPRHIAIIMDGNGRWAREKGLPRVQGHREGVESVRDIAEASAQIGVEVLTLYTFSTENWYRPVTEVNALMKLLVRTIRREIKTLIKNSIRLRAIGDLNQLPPDARDELHSAIDETSDCDRMVLNLALSYSGRWDLVEAARRVASLVKEGVLEPSQIDEKALACGLSTAGLPDPDLLVRTGGEYRISNFLLWEMAYTEIYITETFWPAYRREQLYESIRNYQERDRRFGRIKEG